MCVFKTPGKLYHENSWQIILKNCYSGDNSSFLVFNRDPVDKMIEMLQESFPENLSNDNRRSLAIRAGSKGQLKGGGYTEPSPALETDYLKHFIFFPL